MVLFSALSQSRAQGLAQKWLSYQLGLGVTMSNRKPRVIVTCRNTHFYLFIYLFLRFLFFSIMVDLQSSVKDDFFFFLVFFLYRVAPAAYGGSQARGRIRTVATGLHHSHSNARSWPHLRPHHSSQQCQILNPLSEVRGRTHNLTVPSRICFCCATTGTSKVLSIHLFLSYVNKGH